MHSLLNSKKGFKGPSVCRTVTVFFSSLDFNMLI